MTTFHAHNRFKKLLREKGESLEVAQTLIESELGYLHHIALDTELTVEDRKNLMAAFSMFYAIVKPINAKYIDGDTPVTIAEYQIEIRSTDEPR